jgi:hypothetical protein
MLDEARYLPVLLALGTDESPHRQRKLLDHLRGTGQILDGWDCPEEVCVAGLFHSVYGTTIYRHSSMPASERETLRKMIGREAEELVFLFSICKRPEDLVRGSREWPDKIEFRDAAGGVFGVSAAQFCWLVAMECANIIDQCEVSRRTERFERYLSKIATVMSSRFQGRLKATCIGDAV